MPLQSFLPLQSCLAAGAVEVAVAVLMVFPRVRLDFAELAVRAVVDALAGAVPASMPVMAAAAREAVMAERLDMEETPLR